MRGLPGFYAHHGMLAGRSAAPSMTRGLLPVARSVVPARPLDCAGADRNAPGCDPNPGHSDGGGDEPKRAACVAACTAVFIACNIALDGETAGIGALGCMAEELICTARC